MVNYPALLHNSVTCMALLHYQGSEGTYDCRGSLELTVLADFHWRTNGTINPHTVHEWSKERHEGQDYQKLTAHHLYEQKCTNINGISLHESSISLQLKCLESRCSSMRMDRACGRFANGVEAVTLNELSWFPDATLGDLLSDDETCLAF